MQQVIKPIIDLIFFSLFFFRYNNYDLVYKLLIFIGWDIITFINKKELKLDIRKIDKSQLEEFILAQGLPRFKASQIWDWIWKKSKTSFDDMRNIPKDLRELLSEHFFFNRIEIDKMQKSIDGTIKSRLRLHDGHLIEAVLIPVPGDRRFTACVSSQVGCSLDCKFLCHWEKWIVLGILTRLRFMIRWLL